MNAAQLINQDSGKTEYYTPPNITGAAYTVMGGIDLDPASSWRANKMVGATSYYDRHAIWREWKGRVWMNHPFSRKNNKLWIWRLVQAYKRGYVTQACCITYAATSEKWFRPLLDFPQCYLYKRTNYLLPDGTVKRGVTKGSVVTYLGPNVARFRQVFEIDEKLGKVKV